MKNIIFALMMIMVCQSVRAEWITYYQTSEADELFEPAFISNDQGKIKFWALTNYAMPITNLEGKELLSEKALTTIDCVSHKMGIEKVVKYSEKNAQGLVVGSMETALRMTSVRPGSADQVLMDSLCR